MVTLYVGSTERHSGKNIAVMGIGQRFAKDGLKVGYIKPFGRLPIKTEGMLTDRDAWFIHRVLGIKDPPETTCPVVMTHDMMVEGCRGKVRGLEEKILKAFESISKGKDVVIVGGAGAFESGKFLDISGFDLIEKLGARVLVVDRYDRASYLDTILNAKERLGGRLLGAIANMVELGYVEELEDLVVPFVEGKEIPVFGILPYDSTLGSVMIGDIVETFAGDVLCCRNMLGRLVEHFLIGGMQVDHALEYIRKARNNAVIVGGDRSDVQLAAIEAGSQCLILTGNLYPNEIVISRAELAGIPVVVVRGDTYSVARNVEDLSRKLRFTQKEKVDAGIHLVEERVDFPQLYEALGIKL
jgi:BioD-like phosphotransacetylase family protein